jgi:hypothetical protein
MCYTKFVHLQKTLIILLWTLGVQLLESVSTLHPHRSSILSEHFYVRVKELSVVLRRV